MTATVKGNTPAGLNPLVKQSLDKKAVAQTSSKKGAQGGSKQKK